MLIIIFINVFSSEIILKGLLVMGTIFLYFIFSGYIKPNKSDSINNLDVHISQVTGFTILIGLFICFLIERVSLELMKILYPGNYLYLSK